VSRRTSIQTVGYLIISGGMIFSFYGIFGAGLLIGKINSIARIGTLLFGAIAIIVGVGILRLKKWARKIAIIISLILSIYFAVVLVKSLIENNFDITLLIMSLFAWIMFSFPWIYLIQVRVKEQFNS